LCSLAGVLIALRYFFVLFQLIALCDRKARSLSLITCKKSFAISKQFYNGESAGMINVGGTHHDWT
jgi:hypothetical protein